MLNINPWQAPAQSSPPSGNYQPTSPVLKGQVSIDELIPRPMQAKMKTSFDYDPTGAVFNDQNSFTEAGPPSEEFLTNLSNYLQEHPEALPNVLQDYAAKDEMPPGFLQGPAHDFLTGRPLNMDIPQYQAPMLDNPLLQPPMLGNLNKILSGSHRQGSKIPEDAWAEINAAPTKRDHDARLQWAIERYGGT